MSIWTSRQRESFIIHSVVVAVPFIAGTVSAWLLWQSLFNSWIIASVLVGVVETLALLGFVLHIRSTPSPFVDLRHLLPFISFIPLGWEAYQLLAHNGLLVAGVATAAVTSWLIYIAFQCYGTIERLFDPANSARQQAQEGTRALLAEGERAIATNEIIDGFVTGWQVRQSHLLAGPQAQYPRPAAVAPQAHTASPQVIVPQLAGADLLAGLHYYPEAPQDDPLWPAKVAVWQARIISRTPWSQLEATHNRKTATLRGWFDQVESAHTAREV